MSLLSRDPTQKQQPTPQNFLDRLQNMDKKPPVSKPLVQSVPIKPGLYLVSTPIGNLRDITFRALDILSSVDMIICEDTRVTGKLLSAYGFKKKMQVYNDHSTDSQREYLLQIMKEGQSLALLSDAGTPLVSDPGFKLVRGAIAQDIYVTTIPGSNAVLPALQLSGLPSDQFSFLGFLPPKSAARQTALQKWEQTPGTLLVYESGPRLLESLVDMLAILGDRQAAVSREITKLYEEVKRGKISELIQYYQQAGIPKGEIVISLGQAVEAAVPVETIEKQLIKALETMSVRDSAEMVAAVTGKPKKTIYTLALKLASDRK